MRWKVAPCLWPIYKGNMVRRRFAPHFAFKCQMFSEHEIWVYLLCRLNNRAITTRILTRDFTHESPPNKKIKFKTSNLNVSGDFNTGDINTGIISFQFVLLLPFVNIIATMWRRPKHFWSSAIKQYFGTTTRLKIQYCDFKRIRAMNKFISSSQKFVKNVFKRIKCVVIY